MCYDAFYMGFIVRNNDKGIHGECRRESFVIYGDFGADFHVELSWDKLSELEYVIANIRAFAERHGHIPPPPAP